MTHRFKKGLKEKHVVLQNIIFIVVAIYTAGS